MAQIIEDQNRPLTISDLAALLNDPIVGCCVHWEDVGLQIRIKKSDIDAIKRDQHYQTEDCRREILSRFLRNNRDELSLNDLHKVVKRVSSKYEISRRRAEANNEEKEAVKAVSQLENLLEEWQMRNEGIAADLDQLEAELREEAEVILDITKKWKYDSSEWNQGELEDKKTKILNALKQGDYKNSSFVKEMIQNQDLEPSGLNNRAIECILRQERTEIDIVRLNKLGPGYRQIKVHHKQLEQLNNEIKAYKKLLEERVKAYDKIKIGLKNIGVKNEKLQEFSLQLDKLQITVGKCEKVKKHCDEVYHAGKVDFDKWSREMNAFIHAFNDNVQIMKNREPEFVQALYMLFGLAGGAAAGAVGGGVVGTAILPIIGTVIGAGIGTAVGGVSGLMWGAVKGEEQREKVEIKVRNYRETISKADAMHTDLQDLLHN